jgi:hypothetical protein
VGLVLDDAGDPAAPCGTCGGRGFHKVPGANWRCSACEPPTLPGDAAALGGWAFCSLPPDAPAQDGPPGTDESPQDDDSASAGSGAPSTADARPGAPRPPWTDDRAWIRRWRTAGPTLADREPVARAWIASAPPQPLARCLAAIELRRIAAQHGIAVKVAFQNAPPAPRGSPRERDPALTRAREPPRPDARPGGFPAPEDDGPPDLRTAPIGKCRRCGWTTPLTGRGTCRACETEGRPSAPQTETTTPFMKDPLHG